MKDQYLTIDIYDADSQFLYAQAKLPMFELLRQTRSQVVIAKEVEACAPDSAEFRASIQMILSNQGKKDKEQMNLIAGGSMASSTLNQRETRAGQQPSQSMNGGMTTKKYHKVVRSRPMDLSRIVNHNETVTE